MWFPKSLSWWLKQNVTTRGLAAKRRKMRTPRNVQAHVEHLEYRVTPSVSMLGAPLDAQTTGTLSYTVAAGTNRVLIVAASDTVVPGGGDQASDILTVTYNGQALTQAVEATSFTAGSASVHSIWYLALGDSVSPTTANIVVTTNSNDAIPSFIGAVAYQDVNQASPIGSIAATGSTGVNVSSTLNVSSAVGDMVFDLFGIYDSTDTGTQTPGAGQTTVHDEDIHAPLFAFYQTSNEAGAALVDMSWTSTGEAGTQVAVDIQQDLNSSNVSLSGNTLVVGEVDATANQFAIVRTGAGYQITDNSGATISTSIAGATGSGTNSVVIPFGTIDTITVNSGDGNDSLVLDFTGGALPAILNYNGGTQTSTPGDSLTITGGSTTSQTFNFTNENDGSVVLAGAIAGTINYTGLEPVVSNITATDVSLVYSAATETITVSANGAQTQVDSNVGGESVSFPNPTQTLSIDGGDGDDTFAVNSFGAGFNAALSIIGGNNTDSITLSTPVTLGSAVSTGNVNFTAEAININQPINTSAGTVGDVSFSAATQLTILTGANIVANGDVRSLGAGAVSTAGSVTTTANLGTQNDVSFASAVTLTGDISIDTSAANGNVTFGSILDDDAAASDRNLTISAGTGSPVFTGAVGNVLPLASLTINSAASVTFSSTVATSGNLSQTAGTGTTTFNGTSGAGIGGILNVVTNAITFNTATVTTVGAVTLNAQNAVTQNAGINAGASTVTILANQDGAGGEDFLQNGAGISTSNDTASAVSITVGGAPGSGADARIFAIGTGLGNGRITITATGGSIVDENNDVPAELGAAEALLTAADGVGSGANPFDVDVDRLDVRNTAGGGIFVTNVSGPLTLTDLNAANGAVSGVGGGGEIRANSPLTISADAITSGGMTYTASDSAGAGDDLLITGAGTDVQDTTAGLILNAGDNLTVATGTTVNAATTLDMNVDIGGAVDAAGSTVTLTGSVTAGTSPITVDGNVNNDTFVVASATSTVENIDQNIVFNGGGGAINSLSLDDSGDVTADGTLALPVTISDDGPGDGTVSRLIDADAARTIEFNDLTNVQLALGNTAADVLQVTPNDEVTYDLFGNNPTSPPGDTLIYDGEGTKTITGEFDGTITNSDFQPVNFTGFEDVRTTGGNLLSDVIDLSSPPLDAAGGEDGNPNAVLLLRDPTGTFLDILIDFDTTDANPPVLYSRQFFASVDTITVTGGTDVDTLVVDHSNGVINRAITFDANGPDVANNSGGDALVIRGTPGGGLGPNSRETYVVGGSEDAGTWLLDPDGNRGQGLGVAGNGDEMTVSFTGLEPASSDTVAANFDLILSAGADDASIENGPVLPGGQSIRIRDVGGTFETTDLANKTVINVMGSNGGDRFRLNYTISSAGLTTLNVYGNGVGAVPADDGANDNFDLTATAAGVTADNLFGQNGNDDFSNVLPGSSAFSMSGFDSPVTVDGGAGVDRLALSAAIDPALLATVTNTTLTSAAFSTFTYSSLDSLLFAASQLNDTIDVISTQAGTQYLLGGDSGSDTITIGNTSADFAASVFDGTLAAILGPITVLPEFYGNLGPLGVDTLNVDASGDAALFGPVSTIDRVGVVIQPYLNQSGANLSADTTRLSGFASAVIDYAHDDVTDSIFGLRPNRLSNLNVRGSTGADTINVLATTAIVQTTVDAREGNDSITISGDNLSANNLFQGFDGNDETVLNIAAHIGQTSFAAVQSVQIEGNVASDTVNRDRLTINDNSSNVRQIDYLYLNTQGDINVAPNGAGNGLFGANLPNGVLQVRTTETLRFFDDGSSNDLVRVFGGTDTGTIGGANPVNDILTVGLLANNTSAVVFKDGLPYLTTPPPTLVNSRPGLAGGGLATDLYLNGLQPAAGLTLHGNGNTGVVGTGDRAVVQASSENNLVDVGNPTDIFGFGAGILQPGTGAGFAYDTIVADQGQVSTTNVVNGALTTVNLNVPSFVQSGPADVNQDAALVINGGDEAAPDASGVADNITVTVSLNYNIQVNGNLPDPATFDGDGLPQGDQLNIVGPGSVNIFSDKAVPPNVTTTFGNAVFGVLNTSIERLLLTPSNGVLNLIGDNNDAAVDQNDNFVVRGRDIDAGGSADGGIGEMFVVINGSAPILLNGVQFLNAFGFDLTGQNLNNPDVNAVDGGAGGIDTLDISAWADNSPRSWGVHVNFNEGEPTGIDGAQADLLIYNTVFANPVSEQIVIAPSGQEDGELQVTNAAFGTPIVTINYVNNLDIIVNDNDGFLSDTDTLTLRGTDPGTPNTSGSETFNIDLTAAGDVANPLVDVRDTVAAQSLYRVRNFTGFNTLNIEMLGGADVANVIGRDDGAVSINVDGGNDSFNDPIVIPGVAAAADTFTYVAGSAQDEATLIVARSTAAASTTINTSRVDSISFDGGGGAVSDDLRVFGSPNVDSFNVSPATATFGTVAVGNYPPILYSNLGTASSTILLVNDGLGTGTNLDTVLIRGTGAADAYVWTPTSDVAGLLDLTTGGVTAQFQLFGFSSADVDAQDGVDSITTAITNAIIDQGPVSGSGTITATDAGGNGLLPLGFSNVESSTVTGGTVVVVGTAGDDVITVSATGTVTVANQGGVVQQSYDLSGAATIILNSLGGDDTINISGTFAGAISVIGGSNGTGSDTLNVSGADVTVDLDTSTVTGVVGGPIDFTGVEHLNVTATGNVTVNGRSVADSLEVTPTGANTATIVPSAGGLLSINTDNPGTLTVNGAGGTDSVTVVGTAGADTVNVDRTASTVAVVGLKVVAIGTEAIVVAGGLGDDVINVTGGSATSLTVDGGPPSASDTLNVALTSATVTFGTDPSSGTVNDVSFFAIENLILTGNGDGNVTVNGSNGNDAINQIGNTVTVNNGAVVSFTSYNSLTLNGLNGDDTFNVAPATLVGVGGALNVVGGDPTASDTLIFNGTAAADAITYSPTGLGAGSLSGVGPIVVFSSTEHLIVNGLAGGDALTVSTFSIDGNEVLTPGSAFDSGVLDFQNNSFGDFIATSVDFRNLGNGGSLTLTDPSGRFDNLIYNGTSGGDTFSVNATGQVTLNNRIVVNTPGIINLTLRGLDGDDVFNIVGDHNLPGISVDGGNPSASDVLNFTGVGAGVITVDLSAGTVQQAGTGPVSIAGVEQLNIDGANAAAVVVQGLTGVDQFSVTPTGNASASISDAGVNTAINVNNVTGLTVNGNDGVVPTNVLTVNGSQAADTIGVDLDSVDITGMLSVQYVDIQSVIVLGLAGSDTFNVNPAGAPPISIFGGDPAATLPGDVLNVTSAAAVTVSAGPEADAGSVAAGTDIVTFDEIETVSVTLTGGGAAGAVVINGTNGDDDITVIGTGTNDFTVSINDGPAIQFTDATSLTVNALSGDDDVDMDLGPLTIGVAVDGGLPGAGSDTLLVTSPPGFNPLVVLPTAQGVGTVDNFNPGSDVAYTGIEHITLVGQLADGDPFGVDGTAGDDVFQYYTGATPDIGTVLGTMDGGAFTLPEITFVNMAQTSTLIFNNFGAQGGADTFVFNGTNGNDVISYNGAGSLTNTIGGQLYSNIQIGTAADAGTTTALRIEGLDGNDSITLTPEVGVAIDVNGGIPSGGGDTLTFNGTGAALVTVDLGAGTITETGFGVVSHTGVEIANVVANNDLTVLGTASSDALSVTPTGTDAATVQLLSSVPSVGSRAVINGSSIGLFTVDGAGGTDVVTVNGTTGSDTINVDRTASTVQVNALQLVTVTSEAITVAAGLGDDTINVTGAGAGWTVDGGQPTASDTLNVTATDATVTYGTDPATGTVNDISFLGIEDIGLTGDGTGTVTINGTTGDDAINQNGNTVTVNDGATVTFAAYPTLTLNGNNGDDTFNVSSATLVGVATFNVVGGDPTASDTLIYNGTAGADAITYNPTGLGAGSLSGVGPVVNFTTTEHLVVNGLAGGDAITVDSFNIDGNEVLTPGSAFDSGVLDFQSNSFNDFIATSLDFRNLGTSGSLSLTDAGGRVDNLIYNGTSGADTFAVNATGQVNLNNRIVVNTQSINVLTLRGLDGDDAFNIVGNHNLPGITVDGGNPSASDVLNFTGAGAAVTLDLGAATVTETGFGAVAYTGIEVANVDTTAADLTVLGTAGDDAISVTPTGANAATIRLDSSSASIPAAPVVNGINVGVLTVDAGAGADSVTVNGTSGNDTIGIVKGATTTVQVGALETVNLPSASDETLVVAGGAGTDTFNVSGTTNNGQILGIDGGDPTSNAGAASDVLNITMTTAGTTAVAPGATPDAGVVTSPDGATDFGGIELISLTAAAGANTLNAQGTQDNDTMALQFLGGANRVWINDRAVISFSNYQTVALNGLFGDDKINVTPTGLVGVTTINVAGGDPTASDELVVNGTAGNDALGYNPSNTIGSGSVTVNAAPIVNFATIESVVIDGVGGTDALTHTTPAGVHQVTYTAGAASDQGTIATRGAGGGTGLVPLSFNHIGAGGSVSFASAGGREDILELNGTNDSEIFNVTGGADTIQIVRPSTAFVTVLLNTAGISEVDLRGFDGDDVFNLSGTLPYTGGVTIDAGNPSASDVVNLSNAAAAVVVNFGTTTVVSGYGANVDLIGVEVLNADTTGQNLTINGTAGDDVLTVTPTGANSATVEFASADPAIGSTPVVNGSAIGTLNANLGAGSDRLVVKATQAGETITANSTLVTVGAFETVNYTNTEDLHVVGLAGSDTFNVTPSATTTIFVDGGDPIGSTPGDLLNLFPPGAFVIEPGPENDEGGMRGAAIQRVSWDHIEGIAIAGPGPAKIVGTNGDDDITVIARDASTHAGTDGVQDFTVSVNDGPAILFLNQPTLLIDALAGDDDIVVRAPAPNNAVWNVQLTVAGGTPAAATGDQGDVLEYETPGQQTITYTPGATPGLGVINDITLASSITIAQFLCPVDNLPSSPGSVEKLILDGEGGNDNVTVIGSAGADTFVHTPTNTVDAGSIGINNLLGVTYEDLGAGATLAIDGAGASDTLVVAGTDNNDVFGVLANGNVTLTGHLTLTRTNYENVVLQGLDGDDTFNINGGSTLTTISIEGGNPSASDVVNYTATANAATTVELGASTIAQTGPVGPTVGFNGIERVNLTSSGGASTLTVNGTIDDDAIDVTPTGAGVGSFVRLGLGGSPQFTYTGVGGAFTVSGGAGGFDTLGILGNDVNDTVTSTATTVTIKGGTVTLGANLDYLNISTFGGDDNVTLTGLAIAKTIDAGAGNDTVNLSAAIDALILGGIGNDILIGSPAADTIYGGSGNDILIGGGGVDHEYGEEGNDQFGDLSLAGNGVADDAGADFLFGGVGADAFVWEPGDGSDVMDGGDDAGDVLRFLGSPAANAFLLSAAAANNTHLNVNLGAANVDTAGIENVSVIALAGADSITVNDLSTTEIKAVNIDLGAGDADFVTVNGRNVADDLGVSSPAAGLVTVEGLVYDFDITNVAVADTLTVNGNEGDDTIKANDGVEASVTIVFNGNDGNDFLSADATLNGGDGNDILIGGAGIDTLNGDAGNDLITGLGAADNINGGAGIDTIVEARDANFTLTNAALTIGAEGTDTLTSIERADLTGGLGDNTFNIGAFSGRTTIFGDDGSDTLDFSAQTSELKIDLDLLDENQVISQTGRVLVLHDAIENVIATDFNDLIYIDIAMYDRFVDGGIETQIPPGDRLFVDMLKTNPTSTKIPNGKLGSYDGTVNGAGYTGTINYVDIETLVIDNPNGGGGGGGDLPIDFGAATNYPIANGPHGIVTGDVNGDGILDMIVSGKLSGTVSVRFGNGFGGFGTEAVYNSGSVKKERSITVATSDLDNDGDLDVVVTNRKDNSVGVLLNNGAGVFGAPTTFSTGIGKLGKFPMSVKIGDMNNDGNDDLVTTNASKGKKKSSIAVLLGNGAGGFGAANTTPVEGRKARDLVLGDFNLDGNLDVVATNLFSREIVFMAGNGAGGLAAPVSFPVGWQPTSIIAADFNGDGLLDVAVTCQLSKEISVLYGTGAPGIFSETIGIKYPAVKLEISINSADLNGDGNADLIIANRITNTLSYMLGLGNGTFDTRVDFKVGGIHGREPVAIAYGDLNNDGAIDLLVANAGTDDVSVLLRNPLV